MIEAHTSLRSYQNWLVVMIKLDLLKTTNLKRNQSKKKKTN